MNKKFILSAIFLTIFLDFFNLGLIYPIFSSLIFEGSDFIPFGSTEFYKSAVFGVLIAAFPFGQFLGAPIIGQFSDQYGRRQLLIISLIGTVLTLMTCACAVLWSSLAFLLLGRFIGGLMSGNMTLAYASLADFSSSEEKVRNFSLIPLAIGFGFALGPYLAGILANPNTHSLAGPALPFLLAVVFSLINLLLVVWKFPETLVSQKKMDLLNGCVAGFTNLWKAFQNSSMHSYLWILFLMISANLLFVQFVGPFAIDKFNITVTEVGYLYANAGVSITIGHGFLTRQLAHYTSPENALAWSLISLAVLLIGILFSYNLLMLHIVTFVVMLACAVAYTNAMAMVSNQAAQERQGEVMGVAVSVQSCAEFLPATILGMVAFISQSIPILVAMLCAVASYVILYPIKNKLLKLQN